MKTANVRVIAAGNKMHSGLLPNVTSIGYLTTEEELSFAYSAADVFVLPSLAENLPNTIAESLLCGTPVVAFNTGGVPEMINEGNGISVPLKDSDSLALAIDKVLNENYNRSLIRENAVSVYDKNVVAQAYINVYNSFSSI
jgi:glycosyltransferase involved in cell wall biosynthesis